MKKSPAKPYAVKLANGRIVDNLSYQNAEEMVRLYAATWIDADRALTAISAERAARRAPVTVDASEVR